MEVNRVGCPELVGTVQFSVRNPVFQGDTCKSIAWQDLEMEKYVVVRKTCHQSYLVSKDSLMGFCSAVGKGWEICQQW
jgi:hypothetical protein